MSASLRDAISAGCSFAGCMCWHHDDVVDGLPVLFAAAPELRDLLAEAVAHLKIHPGVTCEAEDGGPKSWPECEWVTRARALLERLRRAR